MNSRRHTDVLSCLLCVQVEDIKRAAEEAARQAQEEAIAASRSDGTLQGTIDTGDLRQQLGAAINHLQAGLVERDTEVRLMLLAALSGEHILFIGPPGTAKSELGRRLSFLYKGRFFERLLTRFSVPEVRALLNPAVFKMALLRDEARDSVAFGRRRSSSGLFPCAPWKMTSTSAK